MLYSKAIGLLRRRERIIYRLVAGLVVVFAVGLTVKTTPLPRQLRAPDRWAYAFAIQSFARGKWVVTDEEMAAGRIQARLLGGHLTQYVNVGPNRWALEKAPGFPLLAVPLQWLGVPQLTNAVLAVFAAAALYALITYWLDEGLACAAVILLLFTPMSLIALRDAWMDTFAGGAVPLIGGALCLLYILRRPTGHAGPALPFSAGLALGWSAVVRLSNLPLIGLCGLHLLIETWRAPQRKPALAGVVTFVAGVMLALGALAVYNVAVFGRVFDTGYAYSLYRVSSAFGPAIGKPGVPVPQADFLAAIQTVGRNLVRIVQPWLIGFPTLLLAIPGWIALGHSGPRLSSWRWVAALWTLAVAASYISFTWIDQLLSQPAVRSRGFFEIARYFFPWVFPLTTLAAAGLARLPRWVVWSIVALYAAGTLWLYVQVRPGL